MDPKPRKPARPIDDDFRPRKKKSDSDNNPMIWVIVGAAAGGLVVVVAGVLGFMLLSKKSPPPAPAANPAPVVAKAPEAAPAAAAPEAPPQPKPIEWVWFELPEPKSYAAFPNGQPSLVPANPAGGGESLTAGLIESTRYTMMDDKKTYSMVVLKMPSELGIIGMTPESLLETVMSDRSKLLFTDGGKVLSTTPGNLKGLPYYYLVVSKSTGTSLICVYAVGTTLVALRVEGKELKQEDVTAKHFLSSYQLKKQN